MPIFFVVLNDSSLGMVKHGQRLTGAEQIGIDLPSVNFADFATSMGAIGIVIESPADLLSLNIEALIGMGKPVMLDVRIDQEAVPPIDMRTGALKNV